MSIGYIYNIYVANIWELESMSEHIMRKNWADCSCSIRALFCAQLAAGCYAELAESRRPENWVTSSYLSLFVSRQIYHPVKKVGKGFFGEKQS